VFSQDPVCFAGTYATADLFLPNEAADYTLLDHSRRILDRVSIVQSRYSEMDAGAKSLAFHARSGSWRFGADISAPCQSSATPGTESRFTPFFLELPGSYSERLFRLYAEEPRPALLTLGAGNTQTLTMADGEDIYVRGRSGREVFSLRVDDQALPGEIFAQAPSLFIAAVLATPAAGQVEWLRICSGGRIWRRRKALYSGRKRIR